MSRRSGRHLSMRLLPGPTGEQCAPTASRHSPWFALGNLSTAAGRTAMAYRPTLDGCTSGRAICRASCHGCCASHGKQPSVEFAKMPGRLTITSSRRAVMRAKCSPFGLMRQRPASITEKWLQMPSCRFSRTAVPKPRRGQSAPAGCPLHLSPIVAKPLLIASSDSPLRRQTVPAIVRPAR